MIHIAICDDERNFVRHMEELLHQYAAESGKEIKVSCFYDGSDLTEKYDATIDLIFLDIQMQYMDGLKAAEKIRKKDAKVGIIFLTTLVQYGLEGYKYQAANYIVKPMQYIRLKTELDRFLERYRQEESPYLAIANDSGKYKVFLKTLRYVETYNRNLRLHTEQGAIISYASMKEMEKELAGKGFVRCHTSYLVNLFFVKGVRKLEIELTTGERIPVSQPKRKEVMETLARYWGDLL